MRPALTPATPSGFPLEEGPTVKRKAIEPARAAEPEKCPKCGGTSVLDFELVEVPGMPAPKDMSQLGAFKVTRCDLCSDGKITVVEAEAFRAMLRK